MKRNHYNPCFWTAYWNHNYYNQALITSLGIPDPRIQKIHALSVKTNSIFSAKVKNVHYEKNLGEAIITQQAAEEFCRRHHPDQYKEFIRDNSKATYPVYIDFEDILTAIEGMPPYRVLLDVIRRQDIASPEEKTFLGCFVFIQLVRSHAIMNSMIELHSVLGIEKFEYFVMLKWMLGDTNALFRAVSPLVWSHWTLFATDSDVFPLCDSPILVQPDSIMVVLSPRLLLEISPRVSAREDQWYVQRSIDVEKLIEFRRRTIGNTFREIILGDRSVLQHWQATPEFQQRVSLMRNLSGYNSLVHEKGQRELWVINAFGNK